MNTGSIVSLLRQKKWKSTCLTKDTTIRMQDVVKNHEKSMSSVSRTRTRRVPTYRTTLPIYKQLFSIKIIPINIEQNN